MAKRMLIDTAHPEETRVVVLNGNRLEEFDFETSTKKQIKGNIYLAKVTRVEPSLQAAFVEYGGNRHGFLAFNEIHPDYYRIPVADRQAALAAERAAEYAANAREDAERDHGDEPRQSEDRFPYEPVDEAAAAEEADDDERDEAGETEHVAHAAPAETIRGGEPEPEAEPGQAAMHEPEAAGNGASIAAFIGVAPLSESPPDDRSDGAALDDSREDEASDPMTTSAEVDTIETVGGDEIEEATRPRARPFRHYKIQEVIKRRQIMLIQVTKEERGNKGAALTTYLSLAGRYCVLMPNTPRGGGVSRKITNNIDRRRLKDLVGDLDVPEGMGVIVRTAGSERSKTEIKRDFEYLLRLWDEIRDLTLKSTAPALIYEEGNLIKRSIRDLYTRDIEEVLVDGEEGYRTAKAFMKMLMPSHAKRVKLYRDPTEPLLHRFQIESQIDAIHSPVVQLRSGGYLVINPTEALVAIDVNSGRSTKERNIEETALKTNLEAAEELARQLRLRDLAGLIVIDFIDMEEYRNRGAVERRLKEAMRFDRARIQLGRISPFGLLELSRQRLRPSLVEASTQPCPYCNGSGHIRSIESTALHVLRAIEEEGMRRRSAEIAVAVPSKVALYVLNQKRAALQHAEARFGMSVTVTSDDTLVPPAFRLDRQRALTPAEIAALPTFAPRPEPEDDDDDIVIDEDEVAAVAAEPPPPPERIPAPGSGEEASDHGPRRRHRRRGRHGEEVRERPENRPRPAPRPPAPRPSMPPPLSDAATPFAMPGDEAMDEDEPRAAAAAPRETRRAEPGAGADERKRRRRGRRGGRRRHHDGMAQPEHGAEPGAARGTMEAETVELVPPAAAHDAAERDVAAAFAASPAPREDVPGSDSVPIAEPPFDRTPPEPRHRSEPQPIAAAPEREPAPEPSAPPPREATTPPPNPRRGWWRLK